MTNAQHLYSFNASSATTRFFHSAASAIFQIQAMDLMYDHCASGAPCRRSQVVHTRRAASRAPRSRAANVPPIATCSGRPSSLITFTGGSGEYS